MFFMDESDSKRGTAEIRASSRRTLISLALLWTGAVVLVSTLFFGWYTVQATGSTGCSRASETLYPLWVTVSSAGTSCPANGSGSFQAAGLDSTGLLYLGVVTLVAIAVGCAVMLGLLFLEGKWHRLSKVITIIALVSMIAGAMSACLVAFAQPSAVCSDQGFYGTPIAGSGALIASTPANGSGNGYATDCNGWEFWSNGGDSWTWAGSSGPWNSFRGHVTQGGASLTWGPGTGWVLDIASLPLIGIGIFIGRRSSIFESGRPRIKQRNRIS